jgi:hypothetical protein
MSNPGKSVDLNSLESSIRMLKLYVPGEEVAPLIEVMEAILNDPQNPSLHRRLSEVFSGLGIQQGAVLTYAPSVAIMLGDAPFGEQDKSEPPAS